MLTEVDRKRLERIAKPHAFDARMEMLANYNAYVLKEATKDRVLLLHGKRTWCEITVVRGKICVDLQEYGVCRFRFRGNDAIHAVRFLAGNDVRYIKEKWNLGKNLAEPREWLCSAAAHDVLEYLAQEAEDGEEDSIYLQADWSGVVHELYHEEFEGASNAPFHLALGEIDWELSAAGLGMRSTDAFLHCLHAAREATRQLARVI